MWQGSNAGTHVQSLQPTVVSIHFPPGIVAVVILLTVECRHLYLVVLCIGLGIRALAPHKETSETRAKVVNLYTGEACSSDLKNPIMVSQDGSG